jgi:hypothetical protein
VAWWYLVFPAVALVITTIAFNLLGDGVRDAMDPRTERIFAAGQARKRRKKAAKAGSGGPSTDPAAPPAPAA